MHFSLFIDYSEQIFLHWVFVPTSTYTMFVLADIAFESTLCPDAY